MSKALDIISAYDALVARANDIVGPHESGLYVHISKPELSRIRIEGNIAILTYAKLESRYYDSGDFLEALEVQFPVQMLFWTEDQMNDWKENLKTSHERRQADERAARVLEQEAREHATYLALKHKYGEKP